MKTALKYLGRIPALLTFSFLALVLVLSTAHASVQPVSLPGVPPSSPVGGDGNSMLPIVSANGRYVLFASTANNLVLTNNNNSVLPQRMNVFLRDRVSDTTTLVSVNLADTGGGNGDSYPAGISTNGQYVLFESTAGDLTANTTNGVNEIFRRDLVNGTTTLVSGSTNDGSTNGDSYGSVMTPDGRYVAFASAASNVVAGDTNGIPDVFVRDLQTGTTTLVSVGTQTTNSSSALTSFTGDAEITPDGHYAAFYAATNLAPGVATSGEIYVRDLQAGNTIWASTNAGAILYSVTGSSNAVSCNFHISDDGKFIAYEVCTNLPDGAPASGIILRHNLQTGSTDIIDTNAYVPDFSPEDIGDLAMSPDGRFVAFVSDVGNNTGTNTAIYLWDSQTGTSRLISADLNNPAQVANGISDSPAVSSNGQWVAFISSATDLATNILTGDCHAYLCNVQTGAIQLLDADANGVGTGVNPTTTLALSAGGSVVAFDSANMLNDNRLLTYDVFAYDTGSKSTDLISAHDPTLASQTPDGISSFTPFSVSTNGMFVAFDSDADDLVHNDTNATLDVFVRDLVPWTNVLVSVNTNGFPGNGPSTDPAISGDGRYVVFTSLADDLIPGDNNNSLDVFLRDLRTGTTTLVSVSTDSVDPGNADSFSPIISTDGRYVLFHSKASNLAAGISNPGIENLFLRDLQTATTYALTTGGVNGASMTPDGYFIAFIGVAPGTPGTALYVWNSQTAMLTYTNSVALSLSSPFPLVSISPDGHKVAFVAGSPSGLSVADPAANTVTTVSANGTYLTHAGLRFSGDARFLTYAAQTAANTNQNVYRYDFQSGTNQLISRDFGSSSAANGDSDSPVISPDGNLVAFRSSATDLVPGDTSAGPQLFIYNASSNTMTLVSVSESSGSAADDRSLNPVFSPDGQMLCFQSWASDLSGNDFNNGCDLFALDLVTVPELGLGGGSTNTGSVFYARLFPAGSFAPSPTVSWQLASGKTYQVKYKDNLSDSIWQNLPGNITYLGSSGYLTDPTAPADKRFYRIFLNP